MYINLNGRLKEIEASYISPMGEGFLYGYGLFETIKILNGKMYFFHEHMKRFIKDLSKLNMSYNIDIDDVEKNCYELIERNGLCNGAIRISCSKNSQHYHLLISTSERSYNKEIYNDGFRLCFTKEKRNPYSLLVNIKSNNYLENMIIKNKANTNGYDEAIFLNIYNNVSEGTISNIFWVKNNELYTPSIDCGILPGIMRSYIIKTVKNLGFKLYIDSFPKDSLCCADEIFITNSLMDVMPVKKLENIKFDLETNTITKKIIAEVNKLYR